MSGETPLAAVLAARIARDGPLPLAEVMAAASAAYYARGDGIGRSGDFVTAPEISQVFGELIGLWCAVAWERLGRPRPVLLVECGPGRGTLMADALRAAARSADFLAAAEVHLIERSAALRARQKAALAGHAVTWHDDLGTVPPGPLILVANEFLDALPIRQFEKTAAGWAERHVAAEDGRLVFVSRPCGAPPILPDAAPPGAVAETSPATEAFIDTLARRLVAGSGAALLIDYGYVGPALGETLQAVKAHAYHPVLADLGEADLTAHVDFGALARVARAAGAQVHGPEAQGTFLARLGIAVRTAQLARGKHAARAAEIAAATRRLTAPDGMGLLLKAMAVTSPSLAPLDGFAQDAPP
jgi:NADH dehydrogenase [ubiquinone] 1 alpha subcomplex assembly factor 7